MKIWVNTICCNEENFIWFAVMSVVDFVDKILIYDTGSTDRTVQIIKEIIKIKPDKIIFKEVGKVDAEGLTNFRQKMLEKSDCDWIILVDGDEVWWKNSIKQLIEKIKKDGKNISGIVVKAVVPVGDIFHIQEKKAGRYEIQGRRGHINLRAINKNIPNLHVDFPHPKEAYLDIDNTPIQERKDIFFMDLPYLHLTHLIRSDSDKGKAKFKHELGKKASEDFKFPEIMYLDYPGIVPSPWVKLSGFGKVKAYLLTPLRQIKRRFLK